MADLSVLETLHELYISITALMFDIALLVVVAMQGGARTDGNRRYFFALLSVTTATALSILGFFLQHADIGVPLAAALFVHLLSYLANIIVAYMMVLYVASFFGPDAVGKKMRAFNRLLLIVPAVMLVVYYFLQMPRFHEPGADVFAHGWFRAAVGFGFELYYMFFCLTFLGKGKGLEKRAKITIAVAFFLTLVAFGMQAMLGARPLVNYVGASLAFLVFYFAAETPDYRKLQAALTELEEETRIAEEARMRADDANRSKSDFLANMSHEIRTPINAVLGMNEMIMRESAGENIQLYAHNIDSAGKNLLSIINDILDFSKIESGRLELVISPYSLSSVLNDVCNMVHFRAKAKDLTFTADVDADIPDRLIGDEVRVRQIITNLLTNAVKYTDTGEVTLQVTAKRGAESADAADAHPAIELVVAVSDTGIGIREEDREKLFTKFERVDMAHNRTIEGTGLGLAITASLLRMMGGDISVESEYGKGSVFTARIPQEAEAEDPIGDFRGRLRQGMDEEETYRETFRAPGARVLVVDDTEMNLTVIEGLLKQTMVLLEMVTSGAQALSLAKDTPYDLILMDQRMPEMDGTQTLQKLRTQEGGMNHITPVICLTADAVQGAKDRYLREGFTDYLSKPVEGRALEHILMRYLPPQKVVIMREMPDAPEKTAQESGAAKPSANGGGQLQLRACYAQVPSLSYEDALHYLATDALIEKTLRQFAESAGEKADEIGALFAAEDYETYTVMVHALKSSARMIGAQALSKAAEHLEACGNAFLSA